jgi:nucleotide-binding universal stress UspA family protein
MTMQILYATDGKPPAREAGRLLARLLDPAHAEVTILAVQDRSTEEANRAVTDVLDAAEKHMVEAGIVSSSMWRQGQPARRIRHELSAHPFDLVAVGAGNHGWLGRWALGSVSNDVLAHSTVPVLVVHRGPPVDDRVRVLVGADGSAAVEHAIDMLTLMSSPARTDVAVRAVIETPDLVTASRSGTPLPPSYVESTYRGARELASKHLEDTVARIRARGFRVAGSVGEGWPGTDLLDLATTERADLMVIGAHRHGSFERLVMGSVSAHVARHAPATLVAAAPASLVDEEPIEEPNGHLARNRFPVRWT